MSAVGLGTSSCSQLPPGTRRGGGWCQRVGGGTFSPLGGTGQAPAPQLLQGGVAELDAERQQRGPDGEEQRGVQAARPEVHPRPPRPPALLAPHEHRVAAVCHLRRGHTEGQGAGSPLGGSARGAGTPLTCSTCLSADSQPSGSVTSATPPPASTVTNVTGTARGTPVSGAVFSSSSSCGQSGAESATQQGWDRGGHGQRGGTHLHQGDEGAHVPLRHLHLPHQLVLLRLRVLAGVLHLPGEGPRRRQPPRPVLHGQVQVQELDRLRRPAKSWSWLGAAGVGPPATPTGIYWELLGWSCPATYDLNGGYPTAPAPLLGHTGIGAVLRTGPHAPAGPHWATLGATQNPPSTAAPTSSPRGCPRSAGTSPRPSSAWGHGCAPAGRPRQGPRVGLPPPAAPSWP